MACRARPGKAFTKAFTFVLARRSATEIFGLQFRCFFVWLRPRYFENMVFDLEMWRFDDLMMRCFLRQHDSTSGGFVSRTSTALSVTTELLPSTTLRTFKEVCYFIMIIEKKASYKGWVKGAVVLHVLEGAPGDA